MLGGSLWGLSERLSLFASCTYVDTVSVYFMQQQIYVGLPDDSFFAVVKQTL
jgi:hypothetical protein